MASYWKSTGKKRCDICECWIADNKASIEFHERGKKHQEKKQKKINSLTRKSKIQNEFNQKADYFLRKMEQGAMKKYREDLKGKGYSDEQIVNMTAGSSSTKPKGEAQKPKKSTNSHRSDPTVLNQQQQTVVKKPITFTPTPGQPYGKWETISEVPRQSSNNSEVSLTPAEPKKEIIEFAEKRIITTDSESEPIAFKKRKIMSNSKSRNIRKRNSD